MEWIRSRWRSKTFIATVVVCLVWVAAAVSDPKVASGAVVWIMITIGIYLLGGPYRRWAAGSRDRQKAFKDRQAAQALGRNSETLATTATSLVRAYYARTNREANAMFAADAAKLGLEGWNPTSQTWAVGQPGVGRTLTLGLLAFAARPAGALTVSYMRAQADVADPGRLGAIARDPERGLD